MKRLLFFFFCLILFVTAKAQKNYAEAIQQGDAAFNNGQYKTAINKYFAAEAFDPGKKNIVKEKVNKVFAAIETLRKKAEDALAESKKQTNLALEAKKEAEKQKGIAELERQVAFNSAAEANRQKNNAQQALKRNIDFHEKSVGKKYQGGIIFYSDSTREHGLIAAEKDFPESYTWDSANIACSNYSITVDGITYDDWHLPTKDELSLLYLNKASVGGFSSIYYWSSSVVEASNNEYAWYQTINDGYQSNYSKNLRYYVRAVRSF